MDEKKVRVVIVHGWASSPLDAWLPWLQRELESRGIEVIAPAFPNPKEPDISAWVSLLRESVPAPDSGTHFVGHSLGTYVILKFIESFPDGVRVGGVVSVASRIKKDGKLEIDARKVLESAQEITALFSDNDYYVPLVEAAEWRKHLFASTTVLKGHGHFSRREGMTELPVVLDLVLQMSGIIHLPDRAGAALLRDGKILLVRRLWDGQEYYAFPGGGIEHGETPSQAIEREIKEELQLAIVSGSPFLEITNLGRRETFFLIRDFVGAPVKSAELLDTRERGIHELVWLTYEECAKATAVYPERARHAFLAELRGYD